MTTILGLSGSLRRASFNSGILRAASELAPSGITVLQGTIREVPLYDADLEAAQGIPPAVQTLQAQLRDADGLLLVTPEYNNGIPGVFKNAIDWMSRGEGLGFFRGKPVAVLGASPGGFGTILALDAWLPVLRTLGSRHWAGGRLLVSRAGQAFDPDGTLQDEKVRGQLAAFVAAYAAHLQASR